MMANMIKNQFFPLGLALLMLTGCSTVPDSRPRWYGGMGEYSLEDDDLKRVWDNGTGEGSSDHSAKQSGFSTSDKRSPFFSFLFGAVSSPRSRHGSRPERESLHGEESLFPASEYMDAWRTQIEWAQHSGLLLKTVALDDSTGPAEEVAKRAAKPPVPANVPGESEVDTLISSLETAKNRHEPVEKAPSPLFASEQTGVIRQVRHIDTIVKPEIAMRNPENAPQDWKKETQSAIELLENELKTKRLAGTLTPEEEIRWRLLCLTVGKPVRDLTQAGSEPVARFWQEQYRGLSVMLGGNAFNGKTESVLNQATGHFQKGLDALRLECPLAVRKALFVQEAAPFGLYQSRGKKYSPGEVVCLYIELENVVSKATSEGEEIVVDCSWEILDRNRQTVLSPQKETCTSHSESILRDIVLNISIPLPKVIEKGNYTLEITLIDRHAARAATIRHQVELVIW